MAVGLDAQSRSRLISEHAVKKAYEFAGAGQQASWPAALEEDMAVTIGDTVHYHQPAAQSKTSKLATAGLVAAALGLGVPAGIAASNYLTKDEPTPVVAPANVGLQTGLTVQRGGALQ